MKNPRLPSAQHSTRKAKPRKNAGRVTRSVAAIEQLCASAPEAASAISLLKSWLLDESGYDEKAWPPLKKALNAQRRRDNARELFRG